MYVFLVVFPVVLPVVLVVRLVVVLVVRWVVVLVVRLEVAGVDELPGVVVVLVNGVGAAIVVLELCQIILLH